MLSLNMAASVISQVSLLFGFCFQPTECLLKLYVPLTESKYEYSVS